MGRLAAGMRFQDGGINQSGRHKLSELEEPRIRGRHGPTSNGSGAQETGKLFDKLHAKQAGVL